VEVDPADGQAAQLLLMADQHARRSGHYGGLEQQHGGAGLGLEAAGLQRMWQQQGAQALGGLSGLVGQMSPADAQQMRQQMQQQMHNQVRLPPSTSLPAVSALPGRLVPPLVGIVAGGRR